MYSLPAIVYSISRREPCCLSNMHYIKYLPFLKKKDSISMALIPPIVPQATSMWSRYQEYGEAKPRLLPSEGSVGITAGLIWQCILTLWEQLQRLGRSACVAICRLCLWKQFWIKSWKLGKAFRCFVYTVPEFQHFRKHVIVYITHQLDSVMHINKSERQHPSLVGQAHLNTSPY